MNKIPKNFTEILMKDLKSVKSVRSGDESLLSAIYEALMAIESMQTEVLLPTLLQDSCDNISVNDVLNSAKIIKTLILDKNVDIFETCANQMSALNGFITNGLSVNGFTANGLTANGLTSNGHTIDQNCGQTYVTTIVRQICSLKKSLIGFKQLLNEMKAKYEQTVQQLSESKLNEKD